MGANLKKLKTFVAASGVFLTVGLPVFAQDPRLDPLFERLLRVEAADAPALEEKIRQEWSKSGSAAMDLLLLRAKKALEGDDTAEALLHLNALTDHAPEFAEGWNLRAAALYDAEKFGPALEALEHALALEPRHFDAMAGLMIMLDTSGAKSEALEVAYLIRAIHPHYENLSIRIESLEAETQGRAL